ncbi:MAG: VOC family protein [Candidatus Omnitrophota bacterium]|nr:MAG: VOC family protein [Candidatus Omnitrophota bacterium]
MLEGKLKDLVSFHHIGIAVRDFAHSVNFYKSLGYKCSDPVVDNTQNVELVMLYSNSFPSIELVKPINKESPINNYLKDKEEVIYHICYTTKNLQMVLDILKSEHRVICVKRQQPTNAFNDNLISFYYIKNVGIVEFLEECSTKT